MEQVQIPDKYKSGLEKLVNIDNQTLNDLIKALKQASPALLIEDLASVVAPNVQKLELEEIEDVIAALISLYNLRDYSGAEIEEVVERISQAVQDDEIPDISEGQKQEFKRRLYTFLELDGIFGVASKSIGDRHDYKRLEAIFTTLVNQWCEETRGMSSTNQMSMHPAYQQIIGMGEAAIPLLLRELEKKSGRWFWALKSITREDPVPSEHRGKTPEMIKAWLDWGRHKGYVW